MKIIITENQLKFINEALGVPDNILDAAEMLYDIVERDIKSIDSVEEEYEFETILSNKKQTSRESKKI